MFVFYNVVAIKLFIVTQKSINFSPIASEAIMACFEVVFDEFVDAEAPS